MSNEEEIHLILSDMVLKDQVRVLCIDFDATIVEIHTFGAWRGSSEELSTYVRPVFVSLLRQAVAMRDYGLYVSIVTFSGQAKLIRKVMAIVLGDEELANNIIIRCNDYKWDWPEGFEQAGKQGHIGSVLQHISSTTNTQIPLSKVMLIDDDVRNIDIAKESGMKTTVFPAISTPDTRSAASDEISKEKIEQFLKNLRSSCSNQSTT